MAIVHGQVWNLEGIEVAGTSMGAFMPPHITNIEAALTTIDMAYHMNHRKNGVAMFDPKSGRITDGIGHYTYKKTPDKNRAEIICDDVYPCDFDMGIVTGMAKRYVPTAKCSHLAEGGCRRNNNRSCTYVVTW
jgi:hypothetical protein